MIRSATARPYRTKSVTDVLDLVLISWRLTSSDSDRNETLDCHELDDRRRRVSCCPWLESHHALERPQYIFFILDRAATRFKKNDPVKVESHKLDSYHSIFCRDVLSSEVAGALVSKKANRAVFCDDKTSSSRVCDTRRVNPYRERVPHRNVSIVTTDQMTTCPENLGRRFDCRAKPWACSIFQWTTNFIVWCIVLQLSLHWAVTESNNSDFVFSVFCFCMRCGISFDVFAIRGPRRAVLPAPPSLSSIWFVYFVGVTCLVCQTYVTYLVLVCLTCWSCLISYLSDLCCARLLVCRLVWWSFVCVYVCWSRVHTIILSRQYWSGVIDTRIRT